MTWKVETTLNSGQRIWGGTNAERLAYSGDNPNVGDLGIESDGNKLEWSGVAWRSLTMIGGTAKTDMGALPFQMDSFAAAGNGTEYNLPARTMSFDLDSDASHAGTTLVEIKVSNTEGLLKTYGWLSVTGNSDKDSITLDRPYAYVQAVCTQHGDDINAAFVTAGA